VIGSIASKCRIGNYTGPNTDQGFYDAVAAAVHDSTNKPSAISISWGQSESGWTQQAMQAMNTLFGTAMAAGIPVFAASGDNGSSDGASGDNADFPASATNCMGCGGTVLPSIANEAVWHDSGGGATGGGQSKIFTKPPYQSNIGFLSMRGVPDVAGDAAPSTGYAVHLNNQTLTFGGTSAVAPLWAAWAALARQKLGTNLGDLHGKLYPLIGTAAFHDITQGNNGSQSARTGYDTCTGCGTPNGTALIAALGGTQPTQYTVAINGPATVIAGQSVSYTATLTPSQPGATYQWLVAGSVAGTGQTLQTIFPSAGNIVLTCNVVVAQNQTVSSAVTITVQTAPVPPPSTNCRTLVDTNCASVQAQLKALAASDQGGGTFSRATVYAYAAQWLVYNQQVLDDAVGNA
jgi:subtilase family serine protease